MDCDPQGTARDWREASPEGANLPPVLGVDRPQMLFTSLQSVDADIAIIDSPGRSEVMSANIVRVSNIALVVIQPSGADIWASSATVKLIQSKKDVGGEIDSAFLINRTNENTILTKQVTEGEWNTYENMESLQTTVGNRAAYARAMTDGISVFDLDNAKAKEEIEAIIKELEEARWL